MPRSGHEHSLRSSGRRRRRWNRCPAGAGRHDINRSRRSVSGAAVGDLFRIPPQRHGGVSLAAAPTRKSRTSKVSSAHRRSHGPHSGVVTHAASTTSVGKCDGVTDNTAALQAAIDAAGKQSGGVVTIPAGVCVLSGRVHVSGHFGVTIDGAGPTRTFLVQHGASNIFQITSPGNTVENLNLNTATFNPGTSRSRAAQCPRSCSATRATRR